MRDADRMAALDRSVHVWSADTAPRADGAAEPVSLLSPEEMERANRFLFPRDRRRFIAAHAALRSILASYLHVGPAAIVFDVSPSGKPRVASPDTSLTFNLSHSDDRVLLAVSVRRSVGVDIEGIQHDIEHDLIAEHFFSPAERDALARLAAPAKGAAFTACWTRKEAYLKATGAGVTEGLDHFDVELRPGVPAALMSDRRDPTADRWRMVDLEVPAGYAAALVGEGHDWDVHRFALELDPTSRVP